MKMPTKIKLNATQIEMAEWAICPMLDYLTGASGELEPEEIIQESELPTVEDGWLVLRDPGATVDLLYRLEEQFEDMADEQIWGTVFNQVIQTRKLTKKIREATTTKEN